MVHFAKLDLHLIIVILAFLDKSVIRDSKILDVSENEMM